MGLGSKKKKTKEIPVEEPEVAVEPEVKKIILTFDEFYSFEQSRMDFNKPCHPDWYMLGASPEHYPKSDASLEKPESAYKKYLTEENK